MEPTNPAAVLPDASQLNAAEPAANAGISAPQAAVSPQAAAALSLAELNELTGRNFTSKESALKSIKDTFTFATTRLTDVENKVAAATANEMGKLRETLESQNKELYYVQHPELAPHRKLIDSLGKNPAEVVNSDIFKETFTKLAGYDATVKLKTVLESNPRLASSRDSITKAADLKRANNGFVTADVERLALQSVKDAYDLN